MNRLFVMLCALALTPVLAHAAEWEIDATHSGASFKVRHLMVSNVSGNFSKLAGKATTDDKDITKSTVEVTIDAASINTNDAKRDEHLKSAEFFDVQKHPKLTFKSKKIQKGAGGKLMMTGPLTIHGVTKDVTFEVEGPTPEIKDPWGNTRRGATATAKINRKDFGLNWNKALEAGGVVVGDEVQLTLDVELVKKK